MGSKGNYRICSSGEMIGYRVNIWPTKMEIDPTKTETDLKRSQ